MSSVAVVEELDALVFRPADRTDLVSNPDDLTELADDHELAGLIDKVMLEPLPTLGAAFMLMTPLPSRDWRRY